MSTSWIADDVTPDVCAERVRANTSDNCQTGVFDLKEGRCSCCINGITEVDSNLDADIYKITRSEVV